jgi:hypothetical protein
MKSSSIFSLGLKTVLTVSALAFLPGLRGAPAKSDKAAPAVSAVLLEPTFPKAVFDVTVKGIKDPFFPHSLRQAVVIPITGPAISPGVFVLKGFSGPLNQRLAIINNRTVAAGEDAEVTTVAGKIKIQCLAIKENSVLIRVEKQPDPIELRLRSGY